MRTLRSGLNRALPRPESLNACGANRPVDPEKRCTRHHDPASTTLNAGDPVRGGGGGSNDGNGGGELGRAVSAMQRADNVSLGGRKYRLRVMGQPLARASTSEVAVCRFEPGGETVW